MMMEPIKTESSNPETSRTAAVDSPPDCLRADGGLPRIAMVSTHGYVAASPPLGAADTGGQVVYVLELSRKLAQLGYEVDIWTRHFEDQPTVDVLNDHVRVIRVPCGGRQFIPKEYLYRNLVEWSENALRFIKKRGLKYAFINSHYWDAGVAGQRLAEVLHMPHLHTPHSIGIWKKRQMEQDHPDDAANFEKRYNFKERIHHERLLYATADLVVATTPQQAELLVQDYGLSEERCHDSTGLRRSPVLSGERSEPAGHSATAGLHRQGRARTGPARAQQRLRPAHSRL